MVAAPAGRAIEAVKTVIAEIPAAINVKAFFLFTVGSPLGVWLVQFYLLFVREL